MQVAVTLVALYILLLGERRRSAGFMLFGGIVAGLVADVHLNGLVVPAALLVMMLVRRVGIRSLVPYIVGVAISAVWWLSVHVLPDPQRFLDQARAFGYPLPISDFLERPVFHVGLELARYLRVDAGSILFVGVAVVSAAVLLLRHRDRSLASLLAYASTVLLFMALIVGNKQPIYAVLMWPVLVLLVGRMLDVSGRRILMATTALIVVVSLVSIGYSAWRDGPADFERYTAHLREIIPRDATVLAQPSAWFGFVGQPFYATQYFAYVGPFEDEVRRLGVDYIIADEYLLDLQLHVLEEIPADEVESFLADDAELVAEVQDSYYGRLQSGGDAPFTTRVYRVIR